MIKGLFLAIAATFLTLSVYLFFYLGLYKGVEIRRETRGPFQLLYKNHIGPYHTIGPVIDEVARWAASRRLDCTLTFGEYLDSPEAVDQDRLRSRGGCVLSAPLMETPPPGFAFETRAARDYLVGVFTGSPAVGPFKVYPKLKKELASRRLRASDAVIEMYRIEGANVTTEYFFPLMDQRTTVDPSRP